MKIKSKYTRPHIFISSDSVLYLIFLCLYSYWPAKREGARSLCYSGQSLIQGGLRLGYEGGVSSPLSATEQER